jgi:carboxypeptidase C (cathepsin A)
VLYLESPAGVGFSTIASYKDNDWAVDDQSSGKQNLEALIDFLQKFPSFRNNDLYVSGESYAGIYVPILVSNILDWNKIQMFDQDMIRIKGMMIGNGVTDWKIDTEPALIDFAFSHSLYSYELREYYLQNCKEEMKPLLCKYARERIRDMINNVNIYDIYRKCFNQKRKKTEMDNLSFSDLIGVESTPKYNKYAYTPWLFEDLSPKKESSEEFLSYLSDDSEMLYGAPPCIDSTGPDTYFNREDVKAALNVNVKLNWEMCSSRIGKSYIRDKTQGSYYLYPKLINSGMKILIYSGDTDAAVPFNGTQQWISNLRLPILSAWRSWRVDQDNLAGYRTIYDGLTFVVVKGTGHVVPQWKPKESFYMISRFLEGKDL